MVLHRHVFWLGRQWAVTGYGVQAVSQSHKMRFDVAAEHIWDDGIDAPMRTEVWFDADDFAQALEVARRRSREDPRTFQLPMSDER